MCGLVRTIASMIGVFYQLSLEAWLVFLGWFVAIVGGSLASLTADVGVSLTVVSLSGVFHLFLASLGL